eukprot:2610705-Alexandrium_andersonii.AAC.1
MADLPLGKESAHGATPDLPLGNESARSPWRTARFSLGQGPARGATPNSPLGKVQPVAQRLFYPRAR